VPEFRVCALIPTYDNPQTVRGVVERVRGHISDVVVVDDGSAAAGREAVAALGREGLAQVTRRAQNGGKGAAVKTGFAFARELGYTHALQVDADGQHRSRTSRGSWRRRRRGRRRWCWGRRSTTRRRRWGG
jgi:glycosyltransferase involved in cell wall biosynthesis